MNMLKILLRLTDIVLTISNLRLDILLKNKSFLWMFRSIAFFGKKYRNIEVPQSRGQALRIAFGELGPIFIKLGQAISIRPDLFPIDIVRELIKLQDQVKPFPTSVAKDIIENSLKDKITSVFPEFDDIPIASASIAQVHSAKINTGEAVIVKVLRPNIEKKISQDIIVMKFMARLINLFFAQSKRFRLLEVINELEKTLHNEIDLSREAANAVNLRRNFKHSKQLYIPKIYWQWTDRTVLVMEKIRGIPITDLNSLRNNNVDLKKLAETGVKIFFKQVFEDKFFHADMHPGNIFVSYNSPSEPKYIAVDFGIVGYFNDVDQRYLASIILAFFNRDFYRVAFLHQQAGWIDYKVELNDFANEIRILSERILDKSLKDISFGHLLMNLLHVGRKFNMHVQPHLLLFQKTLFAIEGLGKTIYPQLNIWDIAKPYLENWHKRELLNTINPMENIDNILDAVTTIPKIPHLLYTFLNDKNLRVKKESRNVFYKVMYFSCGFVFATLMLLYVK